MRPTCEDVCTAQPASPVTLCRILYGLGESQLGDLSVPMVVFGNVKTTVGQFMSF